MFHWDRDEQQPRSETYHDQPYRFGLQPRSSHPFPFTTREYARLLIVRGRIRDRCDFPEREAA